MDFKGGMPVNLRYFFRGNFYSRGNSPDSWIGLL